MNISEMIRLLDPFQKWLPCWTGFMSVRMGRLIPLYHQSGIYKVRTNG